MAEKEYIERKDLINNRPPQRNPDQTGKEEYNKGYNDGIKAFLSCIEIQTSADVAEVVRCKECIYRGREDCAMFYRCNCGEQHTWETDNDFCSYGKRRE